MHDKSIVNPGSTRSLVSSDSLQAEAANEPLAGTRVEPDRSVGELLRTAREKAGLSLVDVASRLRMGVKQLRALEQADYAVLPKGIFLRGFVRNYAKEVGVRPEQALSLLEETHQAASAISASAVVMPSQQNISVTTLGREFATPHARAFIAVVIFGLVLAVIWYWWEYVRPHRAEGGRPKAVAGEQVVSVPIAVLTPAVESISSETPVVHGGTPAMPALIPADPSSLEPPSVAVPPAVRVTTVAPSDPAEMALAAPRPALSAGNGLLGFTFSGDSWVEVIDGNGKSVLARRFKGGDVEEVVGRAPFSVVVGNAQSTRMAYNGKEIDLVPHTRVSVARVTVK